MGSNCAEGVDHSSDRAEQTKERREKSERRQHAEKSLELWHFQLSGFLYDLAQLRSRHIVPKKRSVNNTRDRTRRSRRLVQCLGEIAALNEIGKTLEKFSDVNRRPMQIEKAFRENRDRYDTAGKDGPHQQSPLLDVINHGQF